MQNNLHLQGKVSVCLHVCFDVDVKVFLKSVFADSECYLSFSPQVDNPSMRWQMALYKEMAGKAEDADAPEKVVKRVQEVSAVLYHIEVVSLYSKI